MNKPKKWPESNELKDWPEFEKGIAALELGYAELLEKGKSGGYVVSPLLFRGQSDTAWCLKSTLETYTDSEEMPVREYLSKAWRIRAQIETYTGKKWDDLSWESVDKWCEQKNLLFLSSFPAPDYLVYLRHHGFPSPLLDWTHSPFIAAHFAFDSIPLGARVAIYAYIESPCGKKSQDGSDPVISTLPIDKRTHKRHFVQQSAYTICAAEKNSDLVFSTYDNAFAKSMTDENFLWKFTLPSSIRVDVLKKLDRMNINKLSLFDTEESLMSTVALRTFYLEE